VLDAAHHTQKIQLCVLFRPNTGTLTPRRLDGPTGVGEHFFMAINIKRTSNVQDDGARIVVYGPSGAGKTRLIPTLPNPLVISAESGLLSIKDSDIPYIEVTDYQSLSEAYRFCAESAEAAPFASIAIDSISEIAEVVLAHEKRISKDPRQAYGEMQVQVLEIMRAFRDLRGKHIYFSAKCEKQQDEQGRILYSPSMPGQKLAQQIPYLVDEVFALRVEKDADGNTQRALMCDSDGLWSAKDRSGKLDQWEAPDLGAIIAKIEGTA
jgi:phage nucleotide-binding protein